MAKQFYLELQDGDAANATIFTSYANYFLKTLKISIALSKPPAASTNDCIEANRSFVEEELAAALAVDVPGLRPRLTAVVVAELPFLIA